MITATPSPIAQAIPWLDTFQRSRNLEGDVIILGIGDGELMRTLGAQVLPGERFVIIDQVSAPIVSEVTRHTHGRDLIIINEDPIATTGTEAMELEYGHYRIAWASAGNDLVDLADALVGIGGLVIAPNFGSHLMLEVAVVGGHMLLTNDVTWMHDYRQVLDAYARRDHE